MPAKSKSQFRFMKAVEHGYLDVPSLSKKEAKEYTSSNKSLKKLPERKKKKKK